MHVHECKDTVQMKCGVAVSFVSFDVLSVLFKFCCEKVHVCMKRDISSFTVPVTHLVV